MNVVPHTHWDREWYKPFAVFRMQLVELLDGLLDTLEERPEFSHFQLDGQMAVIDDYLAIRPHNRDRLQTLNRAGRLAMGPWYTLPDEFLVSGETHIRNLRLGLRRADEMGGAMAVGYLPDMFGHIAQMPQILAGFGFSDAVVWRGVPASAAAPAFWWESPDGTRIRAEYLPDGYGNGARLAADGQGLLNQVTAFEVAQAGLVGDDVLWMQGTDHQLPDPHLIEVVHDANRHGGPEVRITSLATHLADAPTGDLDTWRGELRSGARSNLLMGVASCRTDVKQAAARAERALERRAEPLSACWLPAGDWPAAFLESAWIEIIRNAAHDSICGCSADEVNAAVLVRYAEATRVAEALTERALIRALASSGEPMVAVNPTARTRGGMVQVVIPGDEAPPDTQQVRVRARVQREPALSGRAAVAVVMRAALDDPRVSGVSLTEDQPGNWTARLTADRRPREIDVEDLRNSLESIAADPTATVTIETVRRQATQEVLAISAPVDGFGWRGLAPAPLGDHEVLPCTNGVTNGLVSVLVEPDGTFTLQTPTAEVTGLGRIEEDGDAGDTYNWCPTDDPGIISTPEEVAVLIDESGPVLGRVEIWRTYRWPERLWGSKRYSEQRVTVTTSVEIRAGEDLVRIRVSFDNVCLDHRVRAVFPLPRPATSSRAGCAFTIVERGLTAEGGPNESGLPTFPSRGFVSAGGLTVAHDGTPEYELIVDPDSPHTGSALAVTLLRSVGVISRGPMATRALPAGPATPTPAAQMPGPFTTDLALHLGDRNPYEVVDDAFNPLLTAHLPGAGWGDPDRSARVLEVSGAEVSSLTRRDDGRLELRAFNPTDRSTTLEIPGRTGQITDLRGEPTGATFSGPTEIGPHQIITVALDH